MMTISEISKRDAGMVRVAIPAFYLPFHGMKIVPSR